MQTLHLSLVAILLLYLSRCAYSCVSLCSAHFVNCRVVSAPLVHVELLYNRPFLVLIVY